ncbi:MAG TPA: peptidylprolyl isomerase [Methylomirabilota bacterium]|nr:peptidylprolyl isomerase [Methylomirabilota bacterium]
MKRFAAVLVTALLLGAAGAVAAQTQAPATALAIEKGSTVQIEYTLKDKAGGVLDSNKGQPPLTFTQGERQIIPGLERELLGMRAGQEKKVVVKPEDAYGAANPAAVVEVPKEALKDLPPDAVKVGARLVARNSAGEQRPVVVKEIKDKSVILDLNHPLAGQTLYFDVKVLSVQPPKAAGAKPAN